VSWGFASPAGCQPDLPPVGPIAGNVNCVTLLRDSANNQRVLGAFFPSYSIRKGIPLMSNTQTSFYGINDAIERDRMASSPELLVVRKVVHEPMEQGHERTTPRLWEPWLTIGIGVVVMMIAAFI
jgi:hypothetical protein